MNRSQTKLFFVYICVGLFTVMDYDFAASCDWSTQSEMNICAGKNAHGSDTELNALYQKLLAKVSRDGQTSLRTAEKAWLRYRDEQCAFNSLGSMGGSFHDTALALCLKELTDQQIKQLQHQLTCVTGDLACVGQ